MDHDPFWQRLKMLVVPYPWLSSDVSTSTRVAHVPSLKISVVRSNMICYLIMSVVCRSGICRLSRSDNQIDCY